MGGGISSRTPRYTSSTECSPAGNPLRSHWPIVPANGIPPTSGGTWSPTPCQRLNAASHAASDRFRSTIRLRPANHGLCLQLGGSHRQERPLGEFDDRPRHISSLHRRNGVIYIGQIPATIGKYVEIQLAGRIEIHCSGKVTLWAAVSRHTAA